MKNGLLVVVLNFLVVNVSLDACGVVGEIVRYPLPDQIVGCPSVHYWGGSNCGGVYDALTDRSWGGVETPRLRVAVKESSGVGAATTRVFECCLEDDFNFGSAECNPDSVLHRGGDVIATCVYADNYCPMLNIRRSEGSMDNNPPECAGEFTQTSASSWQNGKVELSLTDRTAEGLMILKCSSESKTLGFIESHECKNPYLTVPLQYGLNKLRNKWYFLIGGAMLLDSQLYKAGIVTTPPDAEVGSNEDEERSWVHVWILSSTPLEKSKSVVFAQATSWYRRNPAVVVVADVGELTFRFHLAESGEAKVECSADNGTQCGVEAVSFLMAAASTAHMQGGRFVEVHKLLVESKTSNYHTFAFRSSEVPMVFSQVQQILNGATTQVAMRSRVAERTAANVTLSLESPFDAVADSPAEVAVLVVHTGGKNRGHFGPWVYASYNENGEGISGTRLVTFASDGSGQARLPFASVPVVLVEAQTKKGNDLNVAVVDAVSEVHAEVVMRQKTEAVNEDDVAMLALGSEFFEPKPHQCILVVEGPSVSSTILVPRLGQNEAPEWIGVSDGGSVGDASLKWNTNASSWGIYHGGTTEVYFIPDPEEGEGSHSGVAMCPPDGAEVRLVDDRYEPGALLAPPVARVYHVQPPAYANCRPLPARVMGAQFRRELRFPTGKSSGRESLTACAQLTAAIYPEATAVSLRTISSLSSGGGVVQRRKCIVHFGDSVHLASRDAEGSDESVDGASSGDHDSDEGIEHKLEMSCMLKCEALPGHGQSLSIRSELSLVENDESVEDLAQCSKIAVEKHPDANGAAFGKSVLQGVGNDTFECHAIYNMQTVDESSQVRSCFVPKRRLMSGPKVPPLAAPSESGSDGDNSTVVIAAGVGGVVALLAATGTGIYHSKRRPRLMTWGSDSDEDSFFNVHALSDADGFQSYHQSVVDPHEIERRVPSGLRARVEEEPPRSQFDMKFTSMASLELL